MSDNLWMVCVEMERLESILACHHSEKLHGVVSTSAHARNSGSVRIFSYALCGTR